MNAGGTPGYVAERVEWVRGVDGEGRVVTRSAAECGFRYRGSDLGDLVVTEVALRLPPVPDPEDYALEIDAIKKRKRATQPMHLPSAGCVWRNPPGDAAGRLVEAAGCKGLRAGGAEVSPRHGNFIVNRGGASCADVLALMEEVRGRVLDATGVSLEREVIHWSDAGVTVSGR
jgi:UDP-N-acetylmuramate dehydrogenase